MIEILYSRGWWRYFMGYGTSVSMVWFDAWSKMSKESSSLFFWSHKVQLVLRNKPTMLSAADSGARTIQAERCRRFGGHLLVGPNSPGITATPRYCGFCFSLFCTKMWHSRIYPESSAPGLCPLLNNFGQSICAELQRVWRPLSLLACFELDLFSYDLGNTILVNGHLYTVIRFLLHGEIRRPWAQKWRRMEHAPTRSCESMKIENMECYESHDM